MTDTAIRVEGLSKRYRIGETTGRYKTLRDSISQTLLSPQRWGRALVGQGRRSASDRNEHWALQDVALTIDRGEVIGVIGHNGAGKTTFLKILSRITEPTTGMVEIRGRVGSLLEVGTGFHPELTGRENIYLSGAILGMRKYEIKAKFDEIVEFAGVERFIDTPVKRYSSGMYLRLAFAVAAFLEPDVLMVDEVLAVGDAMFQKKCLGRMGEVAQAGKTVLLVSHNTAAIARLCEKTLVLDKGRVSFFGPTEHALDKYLGAVAAGAQSDLRMRLDRVGSGRTRIHQLTVHAEDGTPKTAMLAGESVRLAMHYESQSEEMLRNALFEIKVADDLGHRLFTLSTYLTGQIFDALPSKGTVYCDVPSLLLAPGVYHTTAIVYVNNELCDMVNDASEFRVIDGGFYNSGKAADRKTYGTFLMPHTWGEPVRALTAALE